MKPPARAVVGNLIWSTDGGVWAMWRVPVFPHAHQSVADKLKSHARLRGILMALEGDSMLLSVCERIDGWDVVADMIEDVDLDAHPVWGEVGEATGKVLEKKAVYRRRYYVAVALRGGETGFKGRLSTAAGSVAAAFGVAPGAVSDGELDGARREAREVEAALRQHAAVERVTAGEVRWLYARALRRELAEPALDESWEPPTSTVVSGAIRGGVVAQLTDAVMKEGGDTDDRDRPRHRRYIRIDGASGTSYQTVLAVAEMPHQFTYPYGAGEWLFHIDDVRFPVDWCVRVRATPNAEAKPKVRRKHRELEGQVGEYDDELAGPPQELAQAISSIDEERNELAANGSTPELCATILFGLAARTLPELERRAKAVSSMLQPHDYGIGRPTGGQLALLRSMLPGAAAAPVCRDYTQYLLPRDLAAGAPFCGPEVGDPRGALMGKSLDGGGRAPVLFDPAYGPQVHRNASLGVVGALGSGKTFWLKRLCWDTIARGGQVVTIDRSKVREYTKFARVVPGKVQIINLDGTSDVCLDPLRVFTGDTRVTVTQGFLSLLAGCGAQSEESDVIAEAVEVVAERRAGRMTDVVEELDRKANAGDEVARRLVRRFNRYLRRGVGRVAFGDGEPLSLDADFIVFSAPHLSLPNQETMRNEHLSRQLLPEYILGQAIVYLAAAVAREVVFSDPTRFGAALYDEAAALLASPMGYELVNQGIRDGRKHNGAIWLASQHPNDMAIGELSDLLGAKFVFRQSEGAIPAALRFLGAEGSDAEEILETGMATGQCLFRDVMDRIGHVEIDEPVLPGLLEAFRTNPEAARKAGVETEQAATESAPAPVESWWNDVITEMVEEAESVREEQPAAPAVPPPTPKPLAPMSLTTADGGGDRDPVRAATAAARERARRRRRTALVHALDGDAGQGDQR